MPKEQPYLSEHSLGATSSKNAKDKSNSTTLLAIRNTKDAESTSGRGSRCSSEKDSGYSDGSDWQQTDVEDQWSNKSQSRGSKCAESSRPPPNREPRHENPGNPNLMPVGSELSPIYIINNMVFKQPDVIQKSGQLPWRNGSREISGTDAAHMILLQQPSLLLATLQLQRPSSNKSNKSKATGKKIKGTLANLNSYPRIAPHPGKKPPDVSSTNDESQNLSKRVCTDLKSDDTPVTRSLPEEQLTKQPNLAIMSSGLPCSSLTKDVPSSSSPTTVSSSQGSPSGSSVSSLLSNRGLHRNGSSSTRHRRFLNTVEILRQSGLLDITLRTKELLRQSNATERDLAQLRQHTEQLCQAASNPSCYLNGITAWEHLHRSMEESGSYPNLRILQNLGTLCHADAASQSESISTSETNGPLAAENFDGPRPHLLNAITYPNQSCPGPQQSHPGHDRELMADCKVSEKVTFMPPDSSTS